MKAFKVPRWFNALNDIRPLSINTVTSSPRYFSSQLASRPNELQERSSFRVYSFGLTENGSLGLDVKARSKYKKYVSKPVRHHFAEEYQVTDVECGFGFSVLAVKSKTLIKLYGCGINSDFQIGRQESSKGKHFGLVLSPLPIDIGIRDATTKIISISAGRAHVAVATDNEGAFLIGNNSYGQCGRCIDETEACKGKFLVQQFPSLDGKRIVKVYCGQDHTFFLTECGKVYGFGLAVDGQTGLGSFDTATTPTLLKGDILGEEIVKLSCRSDSTIALNKKGEVFVWGNNEYYQLCSKGIPQMHTPMHIDYAKNYGKIIDVACGGTSSVILNEEGNVFVFGYGILGGGPNLDKANKPTQLPRTLFGDNIFQPNTLVTSVYAGLSHFAAVNSLNHLYMWGRNRSGCLGIGHIKDQYFPYKVAFSGLACKVSTGVDQTMVLALPYD